MFLIYATWFFLIGTFELHITAGDVELCLSTLCKRFRLPGIIQHQTALECDKGMRGDTIVLRKMDEDSLRIFEFIPISKYKFIYFTHFNRVGTLCLAQLMTILKSTF